MSIKINGVNKSYGDFSALKDVSLAMPSGGLTALLGPSGSGKTTLLRIIGGQESPDAGTVEIEGRDLTRVPAQKRNIGFVFQHYAAFRHMTVAKNVAFGLEIRKLPKEKIRHKVAELLDLVQLTGFGERLPSQLSGGQRQRMALARALAIEPSVLLLDEPFGALDAKVRKELRDWLRRLHDDVEVTSVFVTHDQEEALEVADTIVVVNQGRIEQVGTPDEIYDRPANDFVFGFIGEVTRIGSYLLRPHDVLVSAEHQHGAFQGTVARWKRVGFEVRFDVVLDSSAQQSPVRVQLTRAEAGRLGVALGDTVWVRPHPEAEVRPAEGQALPEAEPALT